jgi:hypothetical protein
MDIDDGFGGGGTPTPPLDGDHPGLTEATRFPNIQGQQPLLEGGQ